jgi:hypothetical protein
VALSAREEGSGLQSLQQPIIRDGPPQFTSQQVAALGGEAFGRLPGEAALRVLVQAADRVAQQRGGTSGSIAVGGDAQRLLQRGLEAVEELVHARLQTLVLPYQRIPGHDANHARVLLGEGKEHLDELAGLLQALGFGLGDAVGEREHRAFDELDEPLVHLRLGSEVPVQRGLGDVEALGQRRGGDALPLRGLEHLRESLQDFEPAFAFGAGHGRRSGFYAQP